MTASSLRLPARVLWLALGIAIAMAFLESASGFWYLLIAVPWLAGLTVLVHSSVLPRAEQTIRRASASPVFGSALAILGGVLMLVAHLFSVSAALLGAVFLGAAILGLAAAGRVHSLVSALAVGSMAMLMLVVGAGVLEVIFQRDTMARRFGAPRELAAWSDRYDRLWERNVLGFRTPHEGLERPDGVLRILALGDSYTWGDKIADSDSTWPALLESALLAEAPGPPVQVMNWGRNGFTTANEAELLRRLGWQTDPDLVIVQFSFNDPLPSYPNFGNENSSWIEPGVRLIPARFRRGPAHRSAFISWIERSLTTIASKGQGHLRYQALYDTSSVGWHQVESALQEIGDSASRRETPVLLVLYPPFVRGTWSAATHPFAAEYAQVAATAERAGLHVLDLAPAFAAEGGDWQRWRATDYDGHPSAAANTVVARTIVRTLRGRDGLRWRRRQGAFHPARTGS